MSRTDPQAAPKGWRAAPPAVWALGVVSMLMDTSSEMVHALLPVFLVGTLGASAAMLGLIEGIAEATASGGAHHIETVWGRGYVLRDPQEGLNAA